MKSPVHLPETDQNPVIEALSQVLMQSVNREIGATTQIVAMQRDAAKSAAELAAARKEIEGLKTELATMREINATPEPSPPEA